MDKEKIIAVIPAHNEEATVSKVIRGVKRHVDEIVLIDDASTDRTAAVAKENGTVVLSNHKRLGYDRTLDNGFALAAKRGAGIILTFDADGQHNPDDIPEIIEPIQNGRADVVVGKRLRHPRISEYLFGCIAKLKAGIDDPICGLKAYHINVYNDIGYFDRISSIGTQLMFNAKKKGYRIVQREITVVKRADVSRFGRRLKANYKIFRALIKTIFFFKIVKCQKDKK